MSLTAKIKEYARRQGFDLVGITSAEPFPETEELIIERIRKGLLNGLSWFSEERARLSCHPQELLPGAKSIIVLGLSYLANETSSSPSNAPHGRISRYAQGKDYHLVFKAKLKQFLEGLSVIASSPLKAKVLVDSAPLVERAAAYRAGLGWFGKNTNIITPDYGSWVFLGEVLCDLKLEPDEPVNKSCGRCQICLSSCPTGALTPYELDNTKCISFLTIENKGGIPEELRTLIGDWVFGCDICQQVCPVNRRARLASEEAFSHPSLDHRVELIPLLRLSEKGFQERFRHSAIKRAKRKGFLRNVCVALGNLGDSAAISALLDSLSDPEPLIREHAAWALDRIS